MNEKEVLFTGRGKRQRAVHIDYIGIERKTGEIKTENKIKPMPLKDNGFDRFAALLGYERVNKF